MTNASHTFAVIDLFAGPGGLAEGFSSVQYKIGDDTFVHPFQVQLSIEKDLSAYQTLLLRSFLRKFGDSVPQVYYDFINGNSPEPDWAMEFPNEWCAAQYEVLLHELDPKSVDDDLDRRLDAIRDWPGDGVVLIGGPPCQPYSLVGRARNQGTPTYVPEEDLRHFLYQEYIRILKRVKPVAFVMENVKGMLSAKVNGSQVFELVIKDLRDSGYELFPLAPRRADGWTLIDEPRLPAPADYILRCEEFGIPQARHRVIVVGIRSDLAFHIHSQRGKPILRRSTSPATVHDVLSEMPVLRSGLSVGEDSRELWMECVTHALDRIAGILPPGISDAQAESYHEAVRACRRGFEESGLPFARTAGTPVAISDKCPLDLRNWIMRKPVEYLRNHESRAHIPDDLARYLYCAIYADAFHESPKSIDFPVELSPEHRNWNTGMFSDRFRVQVRERPSTTVTSHLSKDGHYFIHPDPLQCRSLTVREAARLQTFPDDYLFRGNRTQQYVQVGNAVPPYLAMQIGKALYGMLDAAARSQAATGN